MCVRDVCSVCMRACVYVRLQASVWECFCISVCMFMCVLVCVSISTVCEMCMSVGLLSVCVCVMLIASRSLCVYFCICMYVLYVYGASTVCSVGVTHCVADGRNIIVIKYIYTLLSLIIWKSPS